MSTQTQPNARYRRIVRIRWGVAALVSLLVVAVIWDSVRVMTRPRAQINFTASTLQGKDWSLATYRGKKPVIVSFFATWCSPCKMELPHLVKLREKYRDRGLELVIITRESADEVKKFPEFLQMPVTLITDGSSIFDDYKVDGIPHTLLFDRAGKLAFEEEGYTEASMVELEKRLTTP